ncbi:response regulator transcription factor [Amphibacillus sediminis]|uniref:response regulator transcription factor n=1 Tax=Amphibacillus sediminis TaxID=360185 RepID=UPI0008362674|nr:response regulator transcription factor [Amphibacillus sediminis]
MNRVVLVDDEQFVRKGIIALMDWQAIRYQVVGEASNAEDALQTILEQEPDVVLTDIRMPVYDGLKLIQRVKEEASKVPKFIIITGYSDFEYAQRAVRLGVTDFILKPIDRRELEQTFTELTPIIEKERLEEQANQRFINFGLFQRVIVNHDSARPQELAQLAGDINKKLCYLMIDIRDQVRTAIVGEQINRAISEFIGDPNVFIHPHEQEGFGVILQEKHLPQNLNEVPWFLSRLKSHLEKEIDKKIFLFAGQIKNGLAGLRQSYQAAMIASERRYIQEHDQPLMYQERLAQLHATNTPLNHTFITRFLEKIEENNPKEIRKLINQWVEEVQAIAAPFDEIKMFVFQLEKELESTMRRIAGHNELKDELGSLMAAFNCKKTLNEFRQDLQSYALAGGSLLCKLNKERYNGDIYKVKRYIHQHYSENLTLKKIANQFYMNPVYLGQLFKKTYGVYFKDYLLQVRIEKAKQILRQTDLRIYEVAEEVGFGSSDYFVTQFEKMEGSTPSKYRQRIIN